MVKVQLSILETVGAVELVVAVTKAGKLVSEDTTAESSAGKLTPPGPFRLLMLLGIRSRRGLWS